MKQQSRATALYARLSRDDLMQGDSMSIQTQKTMLMQYAKQNGYADCIFYKDDGYSGTNFERPDFQRMLTDIEDGKIGTVITKDLSRLGRDYLKTGYFIEVLFPENDVRYIAVNDGVDTANGENNEFMPFKNIINEWYAKDASRKVKSAYKTKALNGEFTGPYAPYGYKKSETDKHRLIPDENTAWVVRKIFKLASEGISPFKISTILKNERILKPRAYVMDAYGKYVCHHNVKYPYDWGNQTVINIITNQVYIGHIVSHRHTTKSFKCKNIVKVPEDEWIIVRNRHEPLVDEQTFQLAQETAKVKRQPNKNKVPNIFAGLLRCGTCGKAMSYQVRNNRSASASFACNVYRRHGKAYCSMHYITYEQLQELVLQDIRYHAQMSVDCTEEYVRELLNKSEIKGQSEKTFKEKELQKTQGRIAELDAVIQRMYEDNVLGRLSDERFAIMTRNYEVEQDMLKSKVKSLTEQIRTYEEKSEDISHFVKAIEKYTDLKELDAAILNTLIEKIVVHERELVDGERIQRIEIYYRYVGQLN